MENQTDNEKNGEDEMESTCDKDEGVTEKSEEEVSFPPSIPCKANCLSLMLFFFLAIGLNLFLRVITFLFFCCLFSQWRRIAKDVNDLLDDTPPSSSTLSPTAPKPHFMRQLGWLVGLCCLMTPGLSKDIRCHV